MGSPLVSLLLTASIVAVGMAPSADRPIGRILRAAGYKVQDAATAAEALDLVPTSPHLVIVDATLPDADAADLIRRLKVGRVPPMVILHLPPGSGAEAEQRARESGADGYLEEPMEPRQVLATVRALLDLRRLIVALHSSEERFDVLIQSAPALIVAVNQAGEVVLFNGACEELTGYSRAEVVGGPLVDLLVPEPWRPTVRERFESAAPGALAAPYESPWLTKLGREHVIEWRCFPVPGPEASPWIVSLGFDVTDRRRAEEWEATSVAVCLLLAESATPEAVVPRLLEAIGEGLDWEVGEAWRLEPRHNRLRWSGTWHARGREAWGFEVARRELSFGKGEGLPGRVWASGAPEWVTDVGTGPDFLRGGLAETAGLHSALAFPLGSGAEIEGVMVFFSRAVRERDEALLKRIADLGGRIGLFIARRRAEIALRESEERSRRLFERSLAGIFRMTRDGSMLECNDAFARLLGYASREEVRARNADEFYMDVRDRQRLLQRLDAGQIVLNAVMRLRRADGQPIVVRMNAARVQESGIVCYEGFISGLGPLASSP